MAIMILFLTGNLPKVSIWAPISGPVFFSFLSGSKFIDQKSCAFLSQKLHHNVHNPLIKFLGCSY